jgi:hypothetical protein
MDAYRRGLDGKQAAWASKKYRGHRVLPESLLKDMEDSNMGSLGIDNAEAESSRVTKQ